MNKQPNAEMCFVCGRNNDAGLKMVFYDNGVDTVTSTITVKEQYQGYPNIVHGGVLASILDEVVGRVAMIEDHHNFMMTVNMKVQYRLPVPVNTKIKAEGKLLRLKGRIGKAEGKLTLPDGQIACQAELVLANMPATIATEERYQALGWEIDND
ncbi:MAG: PaaI family thioesterase [Pseudomonadota bacterium]